MAIKKDYLKKIVKVLNEMKVDAIMVAPSEDMQFLSGHTLYFCERFQGLFIKKDGTCFYICNLLSADEAKKVFGPDVKVYPWWDGEIFTDVVKKAFEENGLIEKIIGTNLTARAFNVLEIMEKVNVRFINAKNIMEEIRIIKTPEELSYLRKAADIACDAIEKAMEYIKPGITEMGIRDKIVEFMLQYGGHLPHGIIASGPNSGFPHYMVSGDGRTIEEKDIITIDYGCAFNHLQSDITRTVFVGGITEEERKVYNIVKEANEAGEAAAVEGAFIPDVDKAARSIIEKAGYGNTFITRLGHGIGYKVHEAPDIKQINERYLEKGMAFTIEPGIYIANKFGVRIEDDVAIGEEGTEILSGKLTKEIIVL